MDDFIDQKEYEGLIEQIHSLYGYDFTDYADSSIKRRISHFMAARKIRSVDALRRSLEDGNMFGEFIQELPVTFTEMFRNPSFFKVIREKVTRRLASYPVIKIWIAGCATGEEVYSISILLKEEGLLDRSIIYATDINERSLHAARQGVYSIDNMKTYTANYLDAGGTRPFSEYYTAKYSSVLFNKSLQKNVVFSLHNLATDKSFNEFQFILCRNVLMYFNPRLQSKVIDLFYESLDNFGFLGLGDKESLLFADRKTSFREIVKGERIFMKIK